jgi:hypothetical protein
MESTVESLRRDGEDDNDLNLIDGVDFYEDMDYEQCAQVMKTIYTASGLKKLEAKRRKRRREELAERENAPSKKRKCTEEPDEDGGSKVTVNLSPLVPPSVSTSSSLSSTSTGPTIVFAGLLNDFSSIANDIKSAATKSASEISEVSLLFLSPSFRNPLDIVLQKGELEVFQQMLQNTKQYLKCAVLGIESLKTKLIETALARSGQVMGSCVIDINLALFIDEPSVDLINGDKFLAALYRALAPHKVTQQMIKEFWLSQNNQRVLLVFNDYMEAMKFYEGFNGILGHVVDDNPAHGIRKCSKPLFLTDKDRALLSFGSELQILKK